MGAGRKNCGVPAESMVVQKALYSTGKKFSHHDDKVGSIRRLRKVVSGDQPGQSSNDVFRGSLNDTRHVGVLGTVRVRLYQVHLTVTRAMPMAGMVFGILRPVRTASHLASGHR